MINTENTLGIEIMGTEPLKEVGVNDLKFTEGLEYNGGVDIVQNMFFVKQVAPESGVIFSDEQKSTTSSSEVVLYEKNTYLSGNLYVRLQGLRNSLSGTSYIYIYKNGVASGAYSATTYQTYDINLPVTKNDKISIKGKVAGGGTLLVEIIISGGLTFNPLYGN